MVKVISVRSGKRLNKHDFAANDKLAKEEGRYLGVLPSEDAEFMRVWHDRLTCEKAQIDELIEEYEKNYLQYLKDLTSVFLYLGFKPEDFNPEKEQILISEDGHIWVVEKENE